jgi:hypothetical protein
MMGAMTRTGLVFLALLVGGCAAAPPMPPSSPLRGQTAATMEQDRAECEDLALADPSQPLGTTKGGRPTPYWEVGGPNTAAGRVMTRQRHAAFASCMEARGYKIERDP